MKNTLPINDIMTCKSPAMVSLYEIIPRIARSNFPVLITGATGSGKEVIANLIHLLGKYPNEPFIDINCGSIPEKLMESELFGHEKGAFTSAIAKHKGYFEQVNRGVIFLDEIGELPLLQQVKLLRVLDSRKFRPVGSVYNIEFKGRIITATNKRIELLIEEKKFREDLYYRLAIFELKVPALHERLEDIPDLIQHFSRKCRKNLIFSTEAINEMVTADWPGNIRQLKNFIERVAVLCEEDIITVDSVRSFLPKQTINLYDGLGLIIRKILELDFENKITAIEYHIIQEALRNSCGNKTAAAKEIGVHRKNIERKLKIFNADLSEIYSLHDLGNGYMTSFDYKNALLNYEKALNLAKKYTYSVKFDKIKLKILLKQCVCLRNLYSWNDNNAEELYEEALVLGKRLYKQEKLTTVYFGIWAKHLMSLDLVKALDLAEKYFLTSKKLENPYMTSQALLTLANTNFWLGGFEVTHDNLSNFIELYDGNNEIITDYGYDPFVLYLMLSALTFLQTGNFKLSKKINLQLQNYAEETKNPFSIAIALHAGAWITFLLGDYKISRAYCTRLTEDFSLAPFPFYIGIGMIFKGYYNALEGKSAEGLALVKQGFRKVNKKNGLIFHSIYSIILGRIYCLDNNVDKSLEVIQRGICIADEKRELCYLSNLLRARGELYLLKENKEKAEQDFRVAIQMAIHLKSIPAELDACIILSDLLSSTGRSDEAQKILREILLKITKNDNTYKSINIAIAKQDKLRHQTISNQ